MSNIITPGVGRAGTSQKITVTIFSIESKKLWLVSHKSRVFVFQKYFGHPPFWTFIGHVAYMLRKWQHFHQCPKMGVCTEWVDGRAPALLHEYEISQFQTKYFRLKSVFSYVFLWFQPGLLWKYSNFKRNIFGWKVCFTRFPIIQTGTFIIKIQDFKRNIFGWKVSFRMNSYGSNRDFYEKKHKPNQWIIHIHPFIPFK